MSLLPAESVVSLTPDTWHHGHGGGFSVSSVSCCVTMSLVTERARRNVPAVVAAVVDERRLSGLTHNPCPVTPALLTHGWRLLTALRWRRHGFIRHSKWTSKDAPAIVASGVHEGWFSGGWALPHTCADTFTPRPATPALRAGGRFRLNAGRLLRSFGQWTEHVFAGITAVVDGGWSAESPRSVTATFRAPVGCWWWLHERLRLQDSCPFWRPKCLSVRCLHVSAWSVSVHLEPKRVRLSHLPILR